MGEEWASKQPFCYFCDVGPELGPLVTEGRRKEFARFPEFSDAKTRERIPDPCSEKTFTSSKLDWLEAEKPGHRQFYSLYKQLLTLRKKEIVPLLSHKLSSGYKTVGDGAIFAWWQFAGSGESSASTLALVANLQSKEAQVKSDPLLESDKQNMLKSCILIFKTDGASNWSPDCRSLSPWSVYWLHS
jgi:1,4-alpha-glucan branching enzyme